MIRIKIIENAGNHFAQRFLKNCFGGDEAVAYLASQKAHWLENHEREIGFLTKEFGDLKISIGDDYELFDSEYTDLFEVVE
ncbi:MAG: hypothetical protein WCX79_00495 [Candidatus Paceibacterota bacterium]